MTSGLACSAPSTVSDPIVARASSGVHVGRDPRQPDHPHVQHLAGGPRRLEIGHPELAQPELEHLPLDGPRHLGGMGRELAADRRADEVGAVRVEALLDEQVDPPQIHVAEVDRDLLGVAAAKHPDVVAHHPLAIHVDGIWMLQLRRQGAIGRGARAGLHRSHAAADLLIPRPEGLYCPPGGFHIDPTRPVARALVTHAHSDHATGGHGAVLATRETLDIMAIRLGERFPRRAEAAAFGAPIRHRRRHASRFHPAGHVLGSAQIAVERGGRRIVASGDYKRTPDPTCAGFEPVPCDVFITEATFGLPVFRHPDPLAEIGRLIASLGQFPDRTHLVGVYALGKAQRVIRLLRDAGYDAPVYLHGSLRRLCDYYASRGVALGELADATVARGTARDFAGTVVLGPPSAFAATWVRRFADPLVAFASGWMQVRARARQRGVELPLVISDHATGPS